MSNSLSPLFIYAPVGTMVTGDVVTVNPTTIINPNRTPMLIDEFRFTADATGNGGSHVALEPISAKIELGNIPLTNNYVPLHTMATSYNGTSTSASYHQMVWHLPKPLYVPPNVQLSVSFSCNKKNQVANSVESFNFAIAGRSVAEGTPIPRTIFMPWAAGGRQDMTEGDGGPDRWVTPDNMLGNPFEHKMTITRLLGYFTNDDPRTTPVTAVEQP